MNVLRWATHALLLGIVVVFCWASGDLAPLYGWACGLLAGSMDERHRAWRREESR